MEILVTIGYIAICIVFFSLAIAIHEFGHFIVALKLGLKVDRFSIGFGPAIWKKTWRGVEYRISWIPLGGYVMIPDVDPEGTKKLEGGAGNDKPGAGKKEISPWKEIAVAVAGPGMNILLAVVLAFILSALSADKFGELTCEVTDTLKGMPAEKAGVKEGDTIVSVAGKKVNTWSQMQVEVQIAGGKETEFVIRDKSGAERTVVMTPDQDKVTGVFAIGAFSLPMENGLRHWLPARSPLKQLLWDAGSIFRVLKGLVTPKETKNTAKALGGPLMIVEGIYKSVRHDFWDGIGFLRFLNVNLAVLNLLPIPVLDGGLIMFALIALIFRRRVPEKVVSAVSTVFMFLLLGVMAILIFRDAQRSWRIHTYKPEAAEAAETNTVTTVTNETSNTSN